MKTLGAFSSIDEGLRAIRAGRMVVVVDDEDRENEGDFVMAAEKASADDVNFMAREGRGLICVSMPGSRLEGLGLSLMAPVNTARYATPFTVSVDLLRGTTSGSSAHDRSVTIRALADPRTKPEDLARPGHVFPLRAADEGVLKRPGHTEAALDLVRLAGLKPAGLLCEILAPDGTMANGRETRTIPHRNALARMSPSAGRATRTQGLGRAFAMARVRRGARRRGPGGAVAFCCGGDVRRR